MSDFSIVLPGGGGDVSIFPGGGQYYRILTAVGAVAVSVNGAISAQRAQGEQQHVPAGIQSLRVATATPQTIVVSVTAGGLDDGRVTQTAPVQLAQATTLTDQAPIAVGIAATVIIAAAAAGAYRYGLRFWNQGTADVMIGGAAITLTSGIPIPPGGTWVEETGANAAWFAITAAALTNSISVQVLT